ncbi:MAG: 1-acyl-sn-glycerol-3-phosphate acyltransferase, partial [Alphaproteobacteria bacterium]|nr:1-acyl-sn-glycerol-3-phosphate acyltransferase [Alphaproteobacteria bacterium]
MVFFRSILFQILFWTFSIIINLLWLPSLLMPRRAIVRGMEIWARVSFWLLKHVAGLDYEVRGRENIAPGAALYASKHLSMWETIAPHVLLNDPATIMKRELLSVPFYGWYAQKCEMIVINRAAQAAAVRTMIADAKKRVAEGRPIFIFPEGTRVEMGAASDYKPGVAALYSALGLPCVPVIHNSALFWPRRGLMRKPGRIIVEFLPAIAPG